MKHCPRCQRDLPDIAFNKSKSQAGGLACYCKICMQKYSAKWRAAHPERVRALARKHNRAHRHERHCIRCKSTIPNTPQLLCALCKANAKSAATKNDKDRAKCNNPAKWKANRLASLKRRTERHKEIIQQYKRDHPCACGESDPAALDFHHKDPEDKDFAIATIAGQSVETILHEFEKCIVICSNDHRKGHAGHPRLEHQKYFSSKEQQPSAGGSA